MVLAIYGCGGMGKEMCDLAMLPQEKEWRDIIFIDDTLDESVYYGRSVMPFELFTKAYSADMVRVIIAQGEPIFKKLLFERVSMRGYRFANLVHPDVDISLTSSIGTGVAIFRGCFISSDAVVGDNSTIMAHCVISHDSHIGKHSQLAASVTIGGHVDVGECSYFGLCASIRDRISIGKNSIVGQGAVVIKDVDSETVVVGNPAHMLRSVGDGKVFHKK